MKVNFKDDKYKKIKTHVDRVKIKSNKTGFNNLN